MRLHRPDYDATRGDHMPNVNQIERRGPSSVVDLPLISYLSHQMMENCRTALGVSGQFPNGLP
jgi:hypothetical protein